MIYVSNKEKLGINEETAVTIGKFDGLHLGHQKLIDTLKNAAGNSLKTVLFTFDVSPAAFIGGTGRKMLMTDSERAGFVREAGIDYLVSYPFTDSVRHMSGEDFVRKVLVEELSAKYIVAGRDFKFGYNRSGDVGLLERLAPECGYRLIAEEKVKNSAGQEISSTLVRSLISEGRMEEAAECLGRYYTVSGEIIHGNHMGTAFGIPTINQRPSEEKLLPPFGVYVAKVEIDGKSYGGITNIGCKPTVGTNDTGVETFLYDFDGNTYGAFAKTSLLKFVRPERKFESVKELTEQIRRDAEYGREYLKHI